MIETIIKILTNLQNNIEKYSVHVYHNNMFCQNKIGVFFKINEKDSFIFVNIDEDILSYGIANNSYDIQLSNLQKYQILEIMECLKLQEEENVNNIMLDFANSYIDESNF